MAEQTAALPAHRANSMQSRLTDIGQSGAGDPELTALAAVVACFALLSPDEVRRTIGYLRARYESEE